jgi:hypothetical protein
VRSTVAEGSCKNFIIRAKGFQPGADKDGEGAENIVGGRIICCGGPASSAAPTGKTGPWAHRLTTECQCALKRMAAVGGGDGTVNRVSTAIER